MHLPSEFGLTYFRVIRVFRLPVRERTCLRATHRQAQTGGRKRVYGSIRVSSMMRRD